MLKILKTYKENIFSVLLVITIFVALLFIKLVPFFILLLFLVWVVKFKTFQNFSLKWKWIWPFLGYFLVFAIAFFCADNSKEALKVLERHTSFIILPFLIFCKKWSTSDFVFFGKFYVKIVLLISIISLIYLGYFFLTCRFCQYNGRYLSSVEVTPFVRFSSNIFWFKYCYRKYNTANLSK